jgi:predicted metalloprotease with PDZ domain
MQIEQPEISGQLLALPAWIPGSYMIRDFARNIVTLSAFCNGVSLKVEKQDKQTWKCSPCNGVLIIHYQVYAWDLSVRGAHLDQTHGYFNGASVFLRAVGKEKQRCQVEIRPPSRESCGDWRLATTLRPAGAKIHGFGCYQAEGYEELIDHPVEMGTFSLAAFEVSGVPHEIAISGRHAADMGRLCRDLRRICKHHVRFFGGIPPMRRYLFQVMATGDGYGGLEHRSSTSLLCKRDDLPLAGDDEISADYRRFLGLCSHEYFHLWNVKRIRPAVFKQADLSHEVHTGLLWAFEGITSYYDDLALVRAGLIEPESYLELLAQVITRVTRGSGQLKQTLEASSFDAWTKFYKQDENAPNAIVSYYTKGALAALALDITIRTRTGGRISLDDVMVGLWEAYGKTDTGVQEGDIEALAARISGLDLDGFFDLALRSVEPLPIKQLLGEVGVGCGFRPATSGTDEGGIRKTDGLTTAQGAVLGIRCGSEGEAVRLLQVFDDGAAQASGLAAGDIIVAVDGIRVPPAALERMIARKSPGVTVTIHAFRRDELMTFKVVPKPPPSNVCELWLLETSESGIKEARKAWLHQAV